MGQPILEKLGLTKNEIIIYLALLELGTTTTGPLTKKAGLHTSRVYESLNKLIEKGLVSFAIKSNIKQFSAADPNTLLNILEQEKREVEEIIPRLKAIEKEHLPDEKATTYEGYKGVKNVYDNVVATLKKGDEILVFGARGQDESFMAKTYFKQYTKRRIAKGIKMRMIFNADAKETGSFYSKLPLTQVKYMPKDMKTPAAVDIYSDNVGILVLKKLPMVFLITSKEVADSYRAFFEMLWKMAE
ncbi:MAG: helix-turn-helix domain-containing protein [Candidatus Woesearchaeota archaeon]